MSAPYSIDNSTELTDFIAGANQIPEKVLTDYETRHKTITLMEKYGGGFCKKLAQAWYMADTRNKQRIEQAFPDYMDEYGPGGHFWNA